MTIREENPVMGPIARKELGSPGKPMGRTRYTRMLKVMGKAGARFVIVSECRKWLRENPDPRKWPTVAPSNTPKRPSVANGHTLSKQ